MNNTASQRTRDYHVAGSTRVRGARKIRLESDEVDLLPGKYPIGARALHTNCWLHVSESTAIFGGTTSLKVHGRVFYSSHIMLPYMGHTAAPAVLRATQWTVHFQTVDSTN